MNDAIESRFWNKVRKLGPNECWVWTTKSGERAKRYGVFLINGRSHIASRVAWELANGKISKGLFVCHHCDNPPCCNPSHLFLGTPRDNYMDAIRKGRIIYGKKGEETQSPASNRDRARDEILKLWPWGTKIKDVAFGTGINANSVGRFVRGESGLNTLDATRIWDYLESLHHA